MDVVECPHCEARLWPEERVKGTAENPTFSMCCCKGEVSLPKLLRLPAEQEEYWLGHTGGAKQFRWNARAYNAVLAFSSQAAKIELPLLGGVQVLRINGAASHRLGPFVLLLFSIPTPSYVNRPLWVRAFFTSNMYNIIWHMGSYTLFCPPHSLLSPSLCLLSFFSPVFWGTRGRAGGRDKHTQRCVWIGQTSIITNPNIYTTNKHRAKRSV